ncbi:DUF998 domain-containing protein [Gymnodinialimonas ceratoperidinii]|uniref:DUF998 domain-containing protein n=1 Tax=Gymnodinialimonas ceratoperidinii TaxID=2856823 RepID=A0A8F6YCX8_9RHOB|nr:DUF998 domain-containing protein [Gymnodinialimonas ceratoperidinii]QXT39652.1 DUF998 domain-containing protein [Gymnodinialimonas ceratoperidinii]
MTQSSPHARCDVNRGFLKAMALTIWAGCIAVVVGLLVAQAMVPEYNWIADTISDLAAGENEIIMDVALYGFAFSFFAAALGLSHVRGWDWRLPVSGLSMAGIAALIVVIGARNEYGDNDNDGVVIHVQLVYGLGVLMAAAPFLAARFAGEVHDGYGTALRVLGAVWIVAAPIFFFTGTSYDGLYERGLGLLAIGVVSIIGAMFWRIARIG